MKRAAIVGLVLVLVVAAGFVFVVADPFAPPPSDREAPKEVASSKEVHVSPTGKEDVVAESRPDEDAATEPSHSPGDAEPKKDEAASEANAEPEMPAPNGSEPGTYLFFSDAWAHAWGDLLRQSKEYKEAGAGWKWKTALVVTPDPAIGIDEEQSIYLDLLDGDCLDARNGTPEDVEQCAFVLVATPQIWKEVVEGKRNVNTALLFGQIDLRKGNLTTLLKYIKSANLMVDIAGDVPTEYPKGL